MKPSECIACPKFPCEHVDHTKFQVPDVEVKSESIRVVMIAEAAPVNPDDYFYKPGNPLFQRTTLLAFKDAGIEAANCIELLERGVYLTTAIKCGKTDYVVPTAAINECSNLLERELSLFPNLKLVLLMGDAAVKALNAVARLNKEPRVIPAGSTYKIRSGVFTWRGKRMFPSYLQAGPSFFIEKSKRRMIAEDIKAATSLVE